MVELLPLKVYPCTLNLTNKQEGSNANIQIRNVKEVLRTVISYKDTGIHPSTKLNIKRDFADNSEIIICVYKTYVMTRARLFKTNDVVS